MNRKKVNEVIINVLKSAVLKLLSAKNFQIIADEAGGHSVGEHCQVGLNISLRDACEWISNKSSPG